MALDGDHVGEPDAGQRRERQEEQLEPGPVAGAVGPDEGARPDDLAGGVRVGEGPRDDGEGGSRREELVAGHPVVVEEVAQHRERDVEVERHVERGGGEDDRVAVRLPRLEHGQDHRRPAQQHRHPRQRGRQPDRGDGRHHDTELDDTQDGTAPTEPSRNG